MLVNVSEFPFLGTRMKTDYQDIKSYKNHMSKVGFIIRVSYLIHGPPEGY
jgi:hypothetical protein